MPKPNPNYVSAPYEFSMLGELPAVANAIVTNLIIDKEATVKLMRCDGMFNLHYKAANCRPPLKLTKAQLKKLVFVGKI